MRPRPNWSVSWREMPHFSAMRSAPSNCEVPSYGILRREREAGAGLHGGAKADAAHRLDAAGHHDVGGAAGHKARSEVRGLLARAALRVDGGRRGGDRQARGQPGAAGDVEGLLADLAHAAADDLVDQRGVDARCA